MPAVVMKGKKLEAQKSLGLVGPVMALGILTMIFIRVELSYERIMLSLRCPVSLSC